MARRDKNREPAGQRDAFEQASEEDRPSLIAEFLYFLAHSKKWWLLPILIVLGIAALLAVFAASGVAPFIYA
ncbi:MAG: DUF5989 family protein [Pirellulales bacterium]